MRVIQQAKTLEHPPVHSICSQNDSGVILPRSLQSEGEPGFIKRFDNYADLQTKATRFVGTHHCKARMQAAVRAMPGLNRAEEKILAEAIDIVNSDEYQTPVAGIITARARVFADRCALTLDQVKRARAGLERKGLALRHPDGDHNATKLDIRPFLADIDAHIAYRDGLEAARRQADAVGRSYPSLLIGSDPPGGG